MCIYNNKCFPFQIQFQSLLWREAAVSSSNKYQPTSPGISSRNTKVTPQPEMEKLPLALHNFIPYIGPAKTKTHRVFVGELFTKVQPVDLPFSVRDQVLFPNKHKAMMCRVWDLQVHPCD